ncbi:MAG: LacI family DNA-binding transcriptional regulator [Spirochaetales bacterium]|nr:LacI family DNA-binding transcriptional regulator [Spirochaetales bacterium]
MVTQVEVAKKAGVSFITVYRVLNNKGYVKKETREKVLKTVKALNYYPNHIGQALRKKKVNTIGIVIPEPPNVPVHGMEYYNMLMQGVDRFAIMHNYDILLSTYKQNDPKADYYRLYFQRKVDGLILFIPDMRCLDMNQIVKKKIPCVIIGERPIDHHISYIDSENFDGMYRVTEYLISRGVKKIAFIMGKPYMRNTIDRVNGFLKAMEKNGLPVPDYYIIKGDYTIISGITAMKKIILYKELPEAIICSNDHMAMGVLSEAKKAKIRIPEDMSLVGFDDINIAALIDPPLSTVRQPLFDMGFKASEILFKKIENPLHDCEIKVFPVELVLRKSII